jgi:hypothetical protein
MNPTMHATPYYVIAPTYFVIRDTPDHTRLLFHLKTGDYFAVLATALGFIEEALAKREMRPISSPELALVRDMRDDLLFLHKEYEIRKKRAERTEQGCLE